MKVTIPNNADLLELEITIPHNPELLKVTIDGQPVVYHYNAQTSTVTVEDVLEGQIVDIYSETSEAYELAGEAPIEVNTYPTFQQMKFRINSLDYLPIDRDLHPVTPKD